MQKIAVITGTSSGIGELCANTFLDMGFTVYGGSRTESSILHDNFVDLELDIGSEKSVNSFFYEIERDTEVIDYIVHCAGVAYQDSLDETSSEDLLISIKTNTVGTFNLYKKLKSFLISEETKIINFYPKLVDRLSSETISYSTSFNAKKALVDSIKIEWENLKVEFIDVVLYACNTSIWDEFESIDREDMIQIDDLVGTIEYLVNKPTHLYLDRIELRSSNSLFSS